MLITVDCEMPVEHGPCVVQDTPILKKLDLKKVIMIIDDHREKIDQFKVQKVPSNCCKTCSI